MEEKSSETIAETKEKVTETKEKAPTSINGQTFKVTVENFNKFAIGDTRNFSKYIGNGFAKLLKIPAKVDFLPYHEVYNTSDPKFDENLLIHDAMKFGRHTIIHLAYLAMSKFEEKNGRLTLSYFLDDFKELVETAKEILKDEKFKD